MQKFLSMLNDDTFNEYAAAKGDLSKLSDKALEEVELAHKVANPDKGPDDTARPIVSQLQGAASAASLGFDDEIGGAATALGKTLVGQDTTYEKERDKIRDSKAKLEHDNPGSYKLGGVVGGLGSALATGGGSLGSQVALQGVEGATRSLGDAKSIDSEANIDAAKQGVTDASMAGILGTVAPSLVAKASEYGEAGAAWLKKLANSQAVRSLGGTKGQVEKLGSKSNELGAMLLDKKIVSPLASSKEIAERVATQGEDLANQTKPIYEAAKDVDTSTGTLLDEIKGHIAELRSNPGNAPVIKKLQNYADELTDAGQVAYNPAELRKYRQAIDRTINFTSDAPSQIASKDMRGLIREKEMGAIEKLDPALREQNEGLFKNIHLNSLADDMAEKGAAKSASNNEVGLNSYLAAETFKKAGESNLVTASVLAAKEFGKRYGNQISAVTLDKISKAMTSGQFAPIFASVADKGPSAVAAMHQVLKEKNPEYRAMIGDE